MRLALVTAPATEPVTVAEVRRHVRLDTTSGEPAPGAPTVALASPAVAGNVDNGVHRYRVTLVTADGETEGGTESAPLTVSDKTVNGKVALTAIQIGGQQVTSRKIYRTAANGSSYFLLATIADNTTTTYTDNIADSSLGAGVPTTNSTGDGELVRAIASARREAERITNRALITQTWDYKLDGFPDCDEIELPLPPLQSVTSITYVDDQGVSQTLSASDYVVDTSGVRGRAYLAYNEIWPITRDQPNAVTIRFVCGYGAASAVPGQFVDWMLRYIADQHVNREAIITGTIVAELPGADDALLAERVGL